MIIHISFLKKKRVNINTQLQITSKHRMNKEQIRKDLTKSMKAKDALRTEVIRAILTAFTNQLVAQGERPDEEISEESADKVLFQLAKQRKDAIEQYKNGGRKELAEKEEKELEIIKEYLPEQMSKSEVKKAVKAKKEALGIEDPAKKGILLGAIMKELGSKADGAMVKEAVDQSFSS
jgi:uncharacterized protein YqeY